LKVSEFLSEPGSAVRVRLEEQEADIIRSLLSEMTAMLDAGTENDPVLERLFPRAYGTESDENTYREMVGSDLERGKKRALARVGENVGERGSVDVQLSREEADDWLTALTDIRLAIGTRLDVDEEMMSEELNPDDAKAPTLAVLHWLGWIQESMIERISKEEE
jgi:hypothetical protein